MIRILQQDNKITKAVFAVIIGAAVITMVITLVPGIFDNAGGGADPLRTYATVHTHGHVCDGCFGESCAGAAAAKWTREAQAAVAAAAAAVVFAAVRGKPGGAIAGEPGDFED